MTAALALLILFVDAPKLSLALANSVLIDTYVLGRTLFKRNRGQYQSAIRSSEFWMAVYLHVFVVSVGLPLQSAVLLIAINQAVYNICRGMTKGMPARAQVLSL